MLLDWIDNNSLDRCSQVLNTIYDLRMATKRQLIAATGLKEENLNKTLSAIRKMPSEEKDDWIKAIKIRSIVPEKTSFMYTIYSLGNKGIAYVQQQRLQEVRIREAPVAQMFHFVGINAILQRAIENFGRESVTWNSESDLADIIYLQLKYEELNEPNRRSIIRPDARLRLHSTSDAFLEWYIEFDNNTESTRQLEIKFHRYVELYDRLKLSTPILWVTTTEKRRDYLQRNWNATMDVFFPDHPSKPVSLFVVEGDEKAIFQRALKAQSSS